MTDIDISAEAVQDGANRLALAGYNQEAAMLRALRARVDELSQWRPIETAPKDGTDILVDAPDIVCGCTIVHWKHPGWRLTYDGKLFQPSARQPTRWLPLPDPSP